MTALQFVEFFSGYSTSMLVSPTSPENRLPSANLPCYQEQKQYRLAPRQNNSRETFLEWVSELHIDRRKHTWDDPGLAINWPLTGTGNNSHVWQSEGFFTTFRNSPSAPMCNSTARFSDRRKSWLDIGNFWNTTLGSFLHTRMQPSCW